jgi:cytochrome c peroxidase
VAAGAVVCGGVGRAVAGGVTGAADAPVSVSHAVATAVPDGEPSTGGESLAGGESPTSGGPLTGASPAGGATTPSRDDLVAIGQKMFFDPALSASGRLACANCHDPKYAYGPAPGRAIPRGGPHMNLPGTRAVPSLRYLQNVPPFAEQYKFIDGDVGPGGGYTWDGRASSLQDQAQLPLLAANEMANRTPDAVVKRLSRTTYAREFRNAFGADVFDHPQAAFAAAVAALEAFQHVPAEFFPYSSKYDAFLRGDADLSEQEERGAALFRDPAKGNCASCHLTAIRDGVFPTFTDYDYMNAGVPRNRAIAANSNGKYYDLGLYGPARTDLPGHKEYCGFFRAPTLRNTALRDAFFHNGVFHSLREVVQFYVDRDIHPEKWYPRNGDGSVHQFDDLPAECPNNIDKDPPLDRKLGDQPALTDGEIDDLVAFLQTLTDGYSRATTPASVTAPTDDRAWRAFFAVNRPTDTRGRGADRTAMSGDDEPATWETWKNVKDIFLLGGKDPGPWVRNSKSTGPYPVPAIPSPATPSPAIARFDTGSFAAAVPTKHIVDGVMVAFDPIATATHLNETRLNRPAFEYLRANELYNLDGQIARFHTGVAPSFPAQSVEVKAQWRPIDESERSQFHTTVAVLEDGTRRLYGLTALHIASKDTGTWFWATFEHVDREGSNAPEHAAPANMGFEGTVWENYRLRGTMTRPVDSDGQPVLLANSHLEAGVEHSASCVTCHARASIGVIDGKVSRLTVLNSAAEPLGGDNTRGYVGMPDDAWFFARDGKSQARRLYLPLDFVWSLAKAQPRSAP